MPAWFPGDPSRSPPADGASPGKSILRRWAITAAVVIGLAVGLGGFTFVYARGASYLMNDPEACGNCHIMTDHLEAWVKSSHRAVATCNDCHTPHNLIGKYVTKASNGFWHSFYFTTGRFPDPLRITEGNREVTEGACRYCHGAIVDAIDPPARHGWSTGQSGESTRSTSVTPAPGIDSDELSCIRCHRYVGHLVR